MLFNSINYIIFLPVVLAVYWAVPRSLKKLTLLFASYFFYMSWLPKYGLMVALLTLANYLVGLLIEKCRQAEERQSQEAEVSAGMNFRTKCALTLGLVINLGCLVYFKYVNFFVELAVQGANQFNLLLVPNAEKLYATTFNIILPLGISFFVFEFIHYIVDVARGEKAVKDPVDFALFASFFPSQIAGPIKRFEDFIAQINTQSANSLRVSANDVREGFALLLQGFYKKVALADNLALLANIGFTRDMPLTTGDTWIASLAFAFQVYFDFSGYTDIGRGSALLMGIKLPDNFNFPYLANSIADYWRRWHISLSSWLRDYLYIPLGGSRRRRNFNLFATMTLCGLWHGAAAHYVVFGALQGVLLIINRWYDKLVEKNAFLQSLHSHIAVKAFTVVFTFLLVVSGYMIFRADTVQHGLSLLQTMWFGIEHNVAPGQRGILLTLMQRSPLIPALAIYSGYALIFCWPKFSGKKTFLLELFGRVGWSIRIPLYAAIAMLVVGFAPIDRSSFIYFQF